MAGTSISDLSVIILGNEISPIDQVTQSEMVLRVGSFGNLPDLQVSDEMTIRGA